jgi:serine/threonine protein kinase
MHVPTEPVRISRRQWRPAEGGLLADVLASAATSELFPEESARELLDGLADDLMERGWEEEAAVKVLREVMKDGGTPVKSEEARRLLQLASANDCDSIIECLKTVPPSHIQIDRLLSDSGHDKLVFLARSKTQTKPVVLKRYRSGRATEQGVRAEMSARSHPNLVPFEFCENQSGEPFFIEPYLEQVFNDNSQFQSYEPLANLIFDIVSALRYVQDDLQMIHGDIKPDNLAHHEHRYRLLDFGNCVRFGELESAGAPSGSFRTRAPELLSARELTSDLLRALDVWSVGATVFNMVHGRFPLFQFGETTPSTSRPNERDEFKEKLALRVEAEYDDFVHVPLPEGLERLGMVLNPMLALDPLSRPRPADIAGLLETNFATVLRNRQPDSTVSAEDELWHLGQQIPKALSSAGLPSGRLHRFQRRLIELAAMGGWPESSRRKIQELEQDVLRAIEL